MSEDLKIEKLDGQIVLLTIFNSINENRDIAASNITRAIDELEKDGFVKYIFNIEHLDYVNSRLIGIIASRHYSLGEKGGKIVVVKASDVVKKSFEVTGLGNMVKFFSNKDEAISDL